MNNDEIIEFIPEREPTDDELILMEMELQEDRNEQILQDHRDDLYE